MRRDTMGNSTLFKPTLFSDDDDVPPQAFATIYNLVKQRFRYSVINQSYPPSAAPGRSRRTRPQKSTESFALNVAQQAGVLLVASENE
ncbi:hypothetical protein OUZ56_001983 [Daphnia magna]|uniref:Uncharacterized protein n=1 Tax=Daphnia magna TaxID=35525 RepID=A0ABR0A4C1_9CRUS|nr:hypothetical protein OUZ56_001983 [Daphnia magna]